MDLVTTDLPDVFLLRPKVFKDARGTTFESYNRRAFKNLTGLDVEFVQDNRSSSRRYVLRGLHYQIGKPQGKLVSTWHGEIYDVVVDLRRHSRTFRRWSGFRLSSENKLMAWIPPGFAHGFLVLSETAEVMYKLTDFWSPDDERTICWNDPELRIEWPLTGEPFLSERDAKALPLSKAEIFP